MEENDLEPCGICAAPAGQACQPYCDGDEDAPARKVPPLVIVFAVTMACVGAFLGGYALAEHIYQGQFSQMHHAFQSLQQACASWNEWGAQ